MTLACLLLAWTGEGRTDPAREGMFEQGTLYPEAEGGGERLAPALDLLVVAKEVAPPLEYEVPDDRQANVMYARIFEVINTIL